MAHTTRTIYLSETWDIELWDSGNMRIREGEEATAQDVANECRRFVNDSYFGYDVGVPHFNIELGSTLPEALLRKAIRQAALRVEDVARILNIKIDTFDKETRTLYGTISFESKLGEQITINL